MIIRFSVENYLSFNERQTLDLTAVKTCKERRDENTFAIDKDNALLKVVAIYGANASGKSNLFKALSFMLSFVYDSFADQYTLEDFPLAPFLFDESNTSKPAVFELEFVVGGVWYKYGFKLTNVRVVEEWLYRKAAKQNRMKALFVRCHGDDGDIINPSSDFTGADEIVVEKTRENALFLSACASLAVKEAMAIVDALRKSVAFISTQQTRRDTTAAMYADGKQRENILRFLKKTDPSIDDLLVEPYELDTGRSRTNGDPIFRKRYHIFISHKLSDRGQDIKLPLYALGSLGTRKAFELAGPIYAALASGVTIFIDELDSRLHPILTREIIKLFNSTENNPHNAQLVFNTHDTNLLSCKCLNLETQKKECVLRRDQIYFVERDGTFASKLYSLVDFKDEDGDSIRNDASFEKDYLEGRYGSIPFIGDFSFIRGGADGEA